MRFLELLEAQPKERRFLRVADARLDLALAIRVAHAAGQRRDAVVGEHVAIERVERRIVDVGVEHALAQVVDHRHARRAAQAAESHLVQLRPDLRAGMEGQQPDRLAAMAERQHKKPRAAVLPARGVAHHRALAVVDLRFLARCRLDDGVRLRRPVSAQLADEAFHARVAGREAMVVDQVLPDRLRVAATTDALLDDLPVRLARARRRRPPGARWPRCLRVGGHLIGQFCSRVGGRLVGRFCSQVGGRLVGRIWRTPPPRPRRPHGDPSCLEVGARRLSADSRRLLDASQRPFEPPQRQHLLSLLVAQDVCHPGGGPWPLHLVKRLGSSSPLAGFHPSLIGRFWVSPEGLSAAAEGRPLSRLQR